MRRMFSEKQIEKLAVDGIKEQLNSDDGFENEFPEVDTELKINTYRFDYGNGTTSIYVSPEEGMFDIRGEIITIYCDYGRLVLNDEGFEMITNNIISIGGDTINIDSEDQMILSSTSSVLINSAFNSDDGNTYIGNNTGIVELTNVSKLTSKVTVVDWAYIKTYNNEFEIVHQAGETILTINVLSSKNYEFQIGLPDVQNDYPDVTQLAIKFDGTIYGPTLVGWLKDMTPTVIDSEETTLRSALNTGIFGYVCNRVFCEGI